MNRIFKNPPTWLLILNYILTVISICGSIAILFVDYSGTPFEILAYCIFGLAGATLSYSIYTIVRFTPRIKRFVHNFAHKHAFTKKLLQSFNFRTTIASLISFFVSIAYGVFNGVLGILSSSIWYGSLSIYYILIAVMYGSVVLYKRKSNSKVSGTADEYKIYVRVGILLVVLNTALSVAIAQMIFSNQSFEYGGLMIYASAAYAFYKITMAIVKLFKGKGEKSPILQASININLVVGLVSILALQTALLSTFGSREEYNSIFNTLTGSFVSLFTLGIGIYMIIKGSKKIKLENKHE